MKGNELDNRIIWWTWLWISGYFIAIALPEVRIPWFIYVLLLVMAVFVWLLKVRGQRFVLLLLLMCFALSYYHWFDSRNVTHIRMDTSHESAGMEAIDGVSADIKGRISSPIIVDGDHVSFTVTAHKVTLLDDDHENPLIQPMKINESLQVSIRLLEAPEQNRALSWQRGDDIEVKGILQQPAEARNYGGFDYRTYLRQQHIHWLLTLKGLDSVILSESFHWDALQLLRINDHFRNYLAHKLDQLFPESQAGYMKSLLIGLRVDLDPQQFQQFSNLGLTHILAISGMQVAVFCGVILWILRKLRVTKETSIIIVIALLPAYVLFTGSSPSVVRAGLMAMIGLYVARRNGLKDSLKLLCLVGWIMLLWNPYAVLDVGFQLSFAVTYGLIAGVPWMSQLMPRHSKLFNSILSVTFVAQLVSFPLTIYYFNQFSLLSWLANILLVPFITFVVTPLGTAALLLSLFVMEAGRWLAWLTAACNKLTFGLTGVMDGWSWFHQIWASPSLWWIAAYYTFTATTLWCLVRWKAAKQAQREGVYISFIKNSKLIPLPMLFHVMSLLLLLAYAYNPDLWNKDGKVEFIDVGQGDAILIRTPAHLNILVDGGGTLLFRKAGDEWKQRKNPYEVGIKLLAPLLKKRGIHQLDYVIATHEDADHIGGLQAVLEQIPVRRFYFNGTLKPTAGAEKLFKTAIAHHIPLFMGTDLTTISIDKQTKLSFLYPFNAHLHDNIADVTIESTQNKHSLIFLLEMKQSRFLFTGDTEKGSEKALLEKLKGEEVPPIIDVLKVAHHGSKTSTTEQWLDYWRPKEAVISVGEHNTYGHPTEEVLTRLIQHGIDIFRTDKQGEVEITVNNDRIITRTKLSNE
jgi:competence protein ComEC